MNRETFLKVWYDELEKLAPMQEGENLLLSEFRLSPVVQSCLIALELTKDDTRLNLVLLEENMTTLLEMKSLSFAARNMIDGMRQKVRMMQQGLQD